jgi:2-(1,2-epoxy-1,2-dihydrophenyl)acetyl-CoA isomerase
MPDVLVTRDDGITTITLNRPAALNAFDASMAESVADAIRAAADDTACRVIVLTGAGRGFCAGADLNVLKEIVTAHDRRRLHQLVTSGTRTIQSIVAAPKPVIAAVNGPAAGGGASVAIACDVRIAADTASIGAVFNRIGLHPDLGATCLLPLLAGFGRAMELVLSGDMIPASEAHRIGLFNRVVTADRLTGEVSSFARKLAAKPPSALERAKRSMHAIARGALDETLERELEQQLALIEMEETRKALCAFLGKQ